MTMQKPVFLDYHATTPCDPRVVAAMLPYFGEQFGNVSSRNAHGRAAEKVLSVAKAKIASLIDCQPEEIILTSGATEANNLALRGVAQTPAGRNEILIGAMEHDSVTTTAAALAAQGFKIKTIPANTDGFITPDSVRALLNDQTLLVSVMAANHEIGTIQPVRDIAAIAHEAGALFHCDATQAIGKIPVKISDINADLLSLSGHKIYGPQGIGVLYVRAKPPVNLMSQLTGGAQQRTLRAGTIPLALAVGLGTACQIAKQTMAEDAARLSELTALIWQALQTHISNIRLNGALSPRLPGSLNFCIPGTDADTLLLELSDYVSLSTGSACATGKSGPSPVLRAIGLSDEEIACSIRLCVGYPTTREDALFAVQKLTDIALNKKVAA